MLLTTKVPIDPTQRQQGVLWALSNQCRLLYNWGLEERRMIQEHNQEKLHRARPKVTYTTQQNQLPTLKTQYPKLKWVYSKVLQMTLRKLDSAYQSFLALYRNGQEEAHPPGFAAASISSPCVIINPATKWRKAF